MQLVLVRHAKPVIDLAVDPSRWALSAEGMQAAVHLGRTLDCPAAVVSSLEPKAIGTASAIAEAHDFTVELDGRLGEVVRDEPFAGDFRARRRAYVEGAAHPGWEDRDAVVERIDAAVSDRLTPSEDGLAVLVGHGMAFTLWLTARAALADPGAFWSDLRLPDAFHVDLAEATIRRVG